MMYADMNIAYIIDILHSLLECGDIDEMHKIAKELVPGLQPSRYGIRCKRIVRTIKSSIALGNVEDAKNQARNAIQLIQNYSRIYKIEN